jgi:phosphotransferase system HPr (HPr) family protein
MRVTVSKHQPSMRNSVAEAMVEVRNAAGLHIRVAGMISKTAISFRSKISIARGVETVNARSIVELTALGAGHGTRLTIRAEGADAEAAVKALVELFERKFGED